MSDTESAETYAVACRGCGKPFDALQATWCSCLVSERTIACPACGICFCKASPAVKRQFWAGAPRAMWDRKQTEGRQRFVPPANPAPGDAKRPLVLVVEDEPDILRVASRSVEALGYGLILARNGVEGLELARLYKPDLVLTDALMPRLDGREMCREIKQDPATASVKVVVMTALYTSVKYQTEAYRAYKVDEYLAKPLHSDELEALLRKHLG